MAKVTFQGRIPEGLMAQVEAYRADHGGISPTEAMERMVKAFFGVGNHARFADKRIPTPKKKITWKPLSQFTRSRMEVLQSFGLFVDSKATSSDIAIARGNSPNNVSKRLQELASEGYIKANGEYRKSNASGKMLTLWTVSLDKIYSEVK